jgi:DNA repair protein RecO (recombination protein O)
MSRSVKEAAVVLRAVDYGESDRVVTLLTRERGKLAAFARAARASRRRFGGALEPFTVVAAELVERRESELWTLDSVSPRRSFGAIRGDLARIACAAHACEVARALVRDAEPHPELFDLLVDYLAALDAGPAEPSGLRAVELGILRAAGLAPRLDACARCGGPLPPAGRLRLDPGDGGVLCGGCGPAHPRAPPLSAEAARALLRLQQEGPAAAPLAREVGAEARDALEAFIEHQAGHRLASRKFLDEVGPLLGG